MHRRIRMPTTRFFHHMPRELWNAFDSQVWSLALANLVHSLRERSTVPLTLTVGGHLTKFGPTPWWCWMPWIWEHCRHTNPELNACACAMVKPRYGHCFIKQTHVHVLSICQERNWSWWSCIKMQLMLGKPLLTILQDHGTMLWVALQVMTSFGPTSSLNLRSSSSLTARVQGLRLMRMQKCQVTMNVKRHQQVLRSRQWGRGTRTGLAESMTWWMDNIVQTGRVINCVQISMLENARIRFKDHGVELIKTERINVQDAWDHILSRPVPIRNRLNQVGWKMPTRKEKDGASNIEGQFLTDPNRMSWKIAWKFHIRLRHQLLLTHPKMIYQLRKSHRCLTQNEFTVQRRLGGGSYCASIPGRIDMIPSSIFCTSMAGLVRTLTSKQFLALTYWIQMIGNPWLERSDQVSMTLDSAAHHVGLLAWPALGVEIVDLDNLEAASFLSWMDCVTWPTRKDTMSKQEMVSLTELLK